MAEDRAIADIPGMLPGRACRACIRLKIKCVPHDIVDKSTQTSAPNLETGARLHATRICQRCHRLNLKCATPAPSVVKRKRKKETRFTQIEERLNRLSCLLSPDSTVPEQPSPRHAPCDSRPCSVHHEAEHSRSDAMKESHPQAEWTANRSPVSNSQATLEDSSNPAREGPVAQSRPPNSGMMWNDTNMLMKDSSRSASHPRVQLATPNFIPAYLDPAYESRLFKEFTAHFLCHFPCMKVPADVSVEKLKQERPFTFWACVIPTVHEDRVMFQKLNEEYLRGVGDHMLSRGYKSLDLLQGLLILLAWYSFHAHLNPQYMNLISLCQGLVCDLGLNRPKYSRERTRMQIDCAELMHGCRVSTGVDSNDDRRALLACYILSSKLSFCFERSDPMRYTDHLERCRQELENSKEIKSDVLLLQLTKLHRILGKYVSADVTRTAVSMRPYAALFEDELRQFQKDLPDSLRSYALFTMQMHSARISFYEPSPFVDCESSLEMVENIHACVAAIRDFFTALLLIPASQCHNMPFLYWLSQLHAMIIAAKLVFTRIQGLDLHHIRQELDFGGICASMAEKCEEADRYLKSQQPDRVYRRFIIYAENVRRCKRWYEAKIHTEEQYSADEHDALGNNGTVPDPDSFVANLFDGVDHSMWDTFMGSWNVLDPL